MNTEANVNLSTCKACEGTVSKNAKSCPHCGERKPVKKKSSVGGWILFLIATLILLNALEKITGNGSSSDSSSNSGYSEQASRAKCEKAIRQSVNNPSTLEIDRIVGYGTNVDGSGIRRITQTFSAKNGFGLEQKFDALCLIKPNGELEFNVVEQGR